MQVSLTNLPEHDTLPALFRGFIDTVSASRRLLTRTNQACGVRSDTLRLFIHIPTTEPSGATLSMQGSEIKRTIHLKWVKHVYWGGLGWLVPIPEFRVAPRGVTIAWFNLRLIPAELVYDELRHRRAPGDTPQTSRALEFGP